MMEGCMRGRGERKEGGGGKGESNLGEGAEGLEGEGLGAEPRVAGRVRVDSVI